MASKLVQILCWSLLTTSTSAFVVPKPSFAAASSVRVVDSSLSVIPPDAVWGDTFLSSNAWWLATIDADIAKMSTNEFLPVFKGGLLIMFGGALSAGIVGLILKAGSNYGSVVAEAYAKNLGLENNPEFLEEMPPEWQALFEDKQLWESLSKEENLDNNELVKRVEQRRRQIFEEYERNKPKDDEDESTSPSIVVTDNNTKSPVVVTGSTDKAAEEKVSTVGGKGESNTETDIFSDYES